MSHHAQHGGGGGAEVTTQVGHFTAIVPFIALYGLVTMPKRWPKATRKVLWWAVLLTPIVAFGGEDAFLATSWGAPLLLAVSWHISRQHMKPADYKPSPRKQASKTAQNAALTKYDHLRTTRTWNDRVQEGK